MRASKYLFFTLRKTPANIKNIINQLMLRAGMVRQIASGLYTWLPTGLRVLKKIENIVREEMNNIGAIEIAMPIVQPAELWKESGRWEQYGKELLHFSDRNRRPFVLGPTNEEIVTDLIRKEISSYKQLPLNLFQIQTKFRDEVRPCLGVIRSREFLMKDAYSFHTSYKSLQETYEKMYKAYRKIFTRIGLNFHVVPADTGSIGGNISHEFQALNQIDKKNYVNIKFSESSTFYVHREAAREKMSLVDTSNIKNIITLIKKFNLPIEKIVKTILVKAAQKSIYPFIALLIRGDHELNKTKVEKLPQVSSPLIFASKEEIRMMINVSPEFLGPINIPIPMIIDRNVAIMSDFIAGANIDGKHFFGINWDRDVLTPIVGDLCNTVIKESNFDKKEKLILKKGIEIAHIFQLDNKYSHSMNVFVQEKNNKNQTLIMGCYGIGITRVVSAIVEQNHDKFGIIWPNIVAPFQIAILPINMYRSYRVKKLSEKLYDFLRKRKIDVLMDDRNECLGTMFADIDLIGIPHIVIIGDRNLKNDYIEYKCRRNNEKKMISTKEIFDFLIKLVGNSIQPI